MPRPASIISFERLYLASIGVYLLNAALSWSRTREMMMATPQLQASAALAALVTPIMIASLVITVLVSLLFWHLVARQRSAAGKWLVVVTEAIGALVALLTLVRLVSGGAPNALGATVSLVATGLAVAAAVLLFRPDTRPWFGEDAPEPDGTEA